MESASFLGLAISVTVFDSSDPKSKQCQQADREVVMANLVFEGDMARIQHGFAQCHDLTIHRSVVLDTLNLRASERALEQGCGGGYYMYEIARFIGPEGHVARHRHQRDTNDEPKPFTWGADPEKIIAAVRRGH
jgi:hypothetical protein